MTTSKIDPLAVTSSVHYQPVRGAQMPDTNQLTGRYVLQWFSPRWFIFVMGTGALANVYQLLSGRDSGTLHTLGEIFLYTAMTAFGIALLFMIIRMFVGWKFMLLEWRHASLIQFYSAISIAAAVCATGLLNIPLSLLSPTGAQFLAGIFWWIALIEGVFFLFFIPFKVSTGHHAEPKRALGFWFLSPVGLFVLVFAGNFRAMHMINDTYMRAILFLNTIILGIAIPLTVVFYTIILFRSLFHNFPRRDVAPSFMIGIAPIGVSIVAINTLVPLLAESGVSFVDPTLVASIVNIVSLLLWGFGLWWLGYALSVTLLYFLKHKVPVTLGYWAYIFPPAAYTIATLLLAKSLGLPMLRTFGMVLASVFSMWWLINVVLTIRGMLNKSIFDVAPTFKGDIPYL